MAKVDFTFNFENEKEVLESLRKINEEAKKEVKTVVARSALKIQGNAKRNAPVDLGTLRASITIDFLLDGLSADIGPSRVASAYAQSVEFGTKPHPSADREFGSRQHFPPPQALEKWAQRHGMAGAEFVIARKIFQKGIAPQPYLVPAWEVERPKYIDELKKVLRGLGG